MSATHSVVIVVRGTTFTLNELEVDGVEDQCSVELDGRMYRGQTAQVVSRALARHPDDPWVEAVVSALQRERGWRSWGSGWGRRHQLEIKRGEGFMYHVSPSVNRASILRYGLDWHRMGAAPNVAGSPRPELPGVFLQEHEHDDFFVDMARTATDMWRVRVDGFWLESGPSGWWVVPHPISRERLDLLPPRHFATD